MPTEPLQPFAPPAGLSTLPAGLITPSAALTWLLYGVFAFWVVYTLVIVYHWLKYSHDSRLMIPAIGTHILVSLALMSYALSGTIL